MLYSINEDGDMVVHTMYECYAMPGSTTIFPSNPEITKKMIKKSKTARKGKLQDLYNTDDNAQLIRKIFYRFLVKMLTRVANGDIFMMPGKSKSNICLKPIPDREVKLLRQRGRYHDYDLVKAQFKIPRFVLDFGPNSMRRDIQIYPGRNLIKLAHTNTINNTLTWTYLPKRLNRDV